MHVQAGRPIAAAGTGTAAGAVLMVAGAITEETGIAIIGAATLIVAAMVACLIVLLRQLTDTSAERAALHDKQEGYIAAQATVAAEHERVRRDLSRSAQIAQEMIDQERHALRIAFEEERLALTSKAFKMGHRMALNGTLEVDDDSLATVFWLARRNSSEQPARAASDD